MTGEAKQSPSGPSSPDVALIHGVTADGGYCILRAREDRLELGAVRPLREGVPITGEVVTLRPREDSPLLCDVEVHLKAPEQRQGHQPAAVEATSTRSGPAQVATDEYRKNWDIVWSRPAQKLTN